MTSKYHKTTAAIVVGINLLCSGCAIHYYDKSSGTEHLWGFGHLKMRAVPSEDGKTAAQGVAYVTGMQTLGFGARAGQDYGGVTAGWNSHSRVVIPEKNSSFALLWPTNSSWGSGRMGDLFSMRIGTNSPGILSTTITTNHLNTR